MRCGHDLPIFREKRPTELYRRHCHGLAKKAHTCSMAAVVWIKKTKHRKDKMYHYRRLLAGFTKDLFIS